MLEVQLEAINSNYYSKNGKIVNPFGLLDGEASGDGRPRFLSWNKYRHSAHPETKSLILIHFSDRILNMKAEEIGMRVRLQNKFATLPFLTEAQNNF